MAVASLICRGTTRAKFLMRIFEHPILRKVGGSLPPVLLHHRLPHQRLLRRLEVLNSVTSRSPQSAPESSCCHRSFARLQRRTEPEGSRLILVQLQGVPAPHRHTMLNRYAGARSRRAWGRHCSNHELRLPCTRGPPRPGAQRRSPRNSSRRVG